MFESFLGKQFSFPKAEEKILDFWQKNNIFHQSIENRKDAPSFSFYDGPPFATGLPHYGHFLAGTIKDAIARYKTMEGFCVLRRFGWDCHGLPVECEVEKEYGLKDSVAIMQFGIDRFNEACRSIVLRYAGEWQNKVLRMGRWVDFSQTWKTMDLSYMESVWWVFKEIYNKGLIYEGKKVLPFSTKLGTPLSNFEAGQNYKETDDPSVIVEFISDDDHHTVFLAWTTTPWTLISNMALTVHENLDYVKVKLQNSDKKYIIAQLALSRIFPENDFQILETFKGKVLAGKGYQPLFSYFADKKQSGAFRVIINDFVAADEGTGIVHTAPAFGEVDYYASEKAKIPVVCPVDREGKFMSSVSNYEGVFVKDADKAIIKDLKEKGHLFSLSRIRHRYPFCWRTDTPLIYKAVETWFLSVESIKKQIIAANDSIYWMPEHIKHGRFGKWLEGARDWAISRNRYWGTPIPIWKSEDGEIKVIGSIKELEELVGQPITDLHRHFIDQLTFSENGKIFKRIDEVFDCWFDAGSMPYASFHYPFENKEIAEKAFPADFIAEGVDQTRGWFYTLTVIGTALFGKSAFKNVIVNGIVLAEDGNKMSKRLKNYPDPEHIINKYGADALRFYMLSSPIVRGEDLNFSEKGPESILRKILIPLWNAYSFFRTYAQIYKWQASEASEKLQQSIDLWIVSELNEAADGVRKAMQKYDLSKVGEICFAFTDSLTNWYIRRSRRRFWADDDSLDRREAFSALYFVLKEFSKIIAPFMPFIAEMIYEGLKTVAMPQSVHLCDFPRSNSSDIDYALINGMSVLRRMVATGHSLRKEHHFKVRQPLPAVLFVYSGTEMIREFIKIEKYLIADELNVKDVIFLEKDPDFVQTQIKPNFRVLGKKAGALMKGAQEVIKNLTKDQKIILMQGESLLIQVEGKELLLEQADIEIIREVSEDHIASVDGEIMTILDTRLNKDLLDEGISRELVNKMNTMRRNAGLEVCDKIIVTITALPILIDVMAVYGAYIQEEVLANAINISQEPFEGDTWDINGYEMTIAIEKN
ncbi:isoleucine--tRNA ligase [Candidatus Clavichlamydia salmonicola]|uniref:isoleucine--tRNA ligase n=1 Tax=Candidatus Clavichlamydia salmonicola TaxID=469812 RepID=UPI001891BC9E|nr:isoleucine--tRNA ligase [Candidatus Clavichlamydia salmonicola]